MARRDRLPRDIRQDLLTNRQWVNFDRDEFPGLEPFPARTCYLQTSVGLGRSSMFSQAERYRRRGSEASQRASQATDPLIREAFLETADN
jgi:hypothetical protein